MDKDVLFSLVDIALALVQDGVAKEALERMEAARQRYLQADIRSVREKSYALSRLISVLDASRVSLDLQLSLFSDSLTPEAQTAIQNVLQEMGRARSRYVLEKERIEAGNRFFGTGRLFGAPAEAGSPAAPAPEIINGIALYPGDVLAVTRRGGLYQHYAIYIGNWRVIHYAAESGDFSGHITIHEAPFRDFQGSSDLIYALDFSPQGGLGIRRGEAAPRHSPVPDLTGALMSSLFEALRQIQGYHLYTPEQTVARAKSRLGEKQYFLPTNNCEHFALWCKTGVSESSQVEEWIVRIAKLLLPVP